MITSESQARSVVLDFFVQIGLPAFFDAGASGFLPDSRIRDGVLYYSDTVTASSLLHETGHLAIIPSRFRPLVQDNVEDYLDGAFDAVSRIEDPEQAESLRWQLIHTSDTEATAWAWAAGKHLGLSDELIVRDDEYDGTGADIRFGLSVGAYLGINGLCAVHYCKSRKNSPSALPAYPLLAKWVQD